MRKTVIVSLLLFAALNVVGRSYPFKITSSYQVELVRVAPKGLKYYKAWGEGSSVNKAMEIAMQNAVAASVFTGVRGNEHAGSVPPLCESPSAYHDHKNYFDSFFKKGDFLLYVENVNSQYPSGDDNLRSSKGHKVAVYVVVKYDDLRKKLEQDGIIKSLDSYF